MATQQPLLSSEGLSIDYIVGDRRHHAVQDISFSVQAGERVAVVGESGSGKTTVAQSLIHLLPENAEQVGGTIHFDGTDVGTLKSAQWRGLRGARIGLIPQDPQVSLDPVRTVGDQVAEALRIHDRKLSRASARAEAVRLLADTGIPDARLRAQQYPHQFSGGMLQRVLIAAALAPRPDLLIADEPTSALDVTVQKLILDALDAEVTQRGIALILVTHDLAVAAERSDRILVFSQGELVESGPSQQILQTPQDDYTRRLLTAAPQFRAARPAADPRPRPEVTGPALLEVDTITKRFALGRRRRRTHVTALDGASLTVRRGETVALVGESGSGKSTLAQIILGLQRADDGEVRFDGTAIDPTDRDLVRRIRRRLTIVYQSPFSSLDPRYTLHKIIGEPLRNYRIAHGENLTARVVELLARVGLPVSYLYRLPGELSGGQRQRVAIARALALEPELIVLDEPVSALDVTVQAQILDLLADTQRETGTAYLFISHDLAVVQQIADRVAVLNSGVLEEFGPTDEVLSTPATDYTRRLISAIPTPGDVHFDLVPPHAQPSAVAHE